MLTIFNHGINKSTLNDVQYSFKFKNSSEFKCKLVLKNIMISLVMFTLFPRKKPADTQLN